MILKTLNIKDLFELIQKQTELVNWYWNIYIATVVVVVGWFVTRSKVDGSINPEQQKWIKRGFIVYAVADLVIVLHSTFILALFLDELRSRVPYPSLSIKQPYLILGIFNVWIYVGFAFIIHILGDLAAYKILSKSISDKNSNQ